MKKPKILVVGSLVMDLIVTASRLPNIGETVLGTSFATAPGGKGANQAVQAARLGADVTMVGMLGNDDFGNAMLKSLKDSGVNTEFIGRTDKAPTAIGNVQLQVNENGADNRIVVVSGANFEITEDDVAFLKKSISNYDMVILQQEIPAHINLLVARFAKDAGVPVMLNPAPYREIDPELLKCLTYISPNEHEAADITGIEPDGEDTIKSAASKLSEMGVENSFITLGKRGCVLSADGKLYFGDSVDCGPVVDTTAAGDSFVAAFCTAISAGVPIKNVLEFANCTAGITVSRKGAQPSLPNLDEVIEVMNKKGYEVKYGNA